MLQARGGRHRADREPAAQQRRALTPTVDEVAAAVGIIRPPLQTFPSKGDLAAAAMVRVMRRAQEFLRAVAAELSPLDKLRCVARWTMEVQLAGEIPSLPANS